MSGGSQVESQTHPRMEVECFELLELLCAC